MANIILTADDKHDLLTCHTINTIDTDGNEHILSGDDLTGTQIEMLENDEPIILNGHNIATEGV